MAFGIQNLTNQTANQSTGIEINQTAERIFQSTTGEVAGAEPLLGLLLLATLGYILYTAEIRMDVSISILVPATLFLAWRDLLPFSQAVIYGVVFVVAGLFAFAVYRFAFR